MVLADATSGGAVLVRDDGSGESVSLTRGALDVTMAPLSALVITRE